MIFLTASEGLLLAIAYPLEAKLSSKDLQGLSVDPASDISDETLLA